MFNQNNKPQNKVGQVLERGDAVVSVGGFIASCHPWVLALLAAAVVSLGVLAYLVVVVVVQWASPDELTRLITALWPAGMS